MIRAILILFTCQLAGDWLVASWQLPLPGPIVGMILMLTYLVVRGGIPEALQRVCAPLLQHMSLFFIPAGAGLLLYLDRVAAEWQAITAALLVSTVLTLIVSAKTMEWFKDWASSENPDVPPEGGE